MALIIPGVQVQVIKEVVPAAANPAGIVGLVGLTDKGPAGGARVASWKQFVDVFGAASAYSLPEARQVLENGAFEVVVVPAQIGSARAGAELLDSNGTKAVLLRARAAGIWAQEGPLTAQISNVRTGATPQDTIFDLTLRLRDTAEVYRNVQVGVPAGPGYLLDVVNGNSALVVATPLAADIGPAPADAAEVQFTQEGEQQPLVNGVTLKWLHTAAGKVRVVRAAGQATFDLQVYVGSQVVEYHAGLQLDADNEPDGTQAIVAALAASPYVQARLTIPATITDLAAQHAVFGADPLLVGSEPSLAAYQGALDQLTREADVNIVIASVNGSDTNLYTQVYAAVRDHCEAMSQEAKNRIGIGGAPRHHDVAQIITMSQVFNSERFVLVAPSGIAGAVAGRIAQLPYFHAPTFKGLAGVTSLATDYLPTDLRSLLKSNILPVDLDRQLGFIVIKGITTSGEQISVTRVQDYAVRGVKGIADLFIGKLNNQLARLSLRQKITEFFQQMQKDGAIVPSVDGESPAYLVNVYSSQADFAQGIVRVDIAIRPVRAIDYVYATILVQA